MTSAVKVVCPATRLLVVKCGREHAKMLQASLVMLTSVKSTAVAVRVLAVSGSFGSARLPDGLWYFHAVPVPRGACCTASALLLVACNPTPDRVLRGRFFVQAQRAASLRR